MRASRGVDVGEVAALLALLFLVVPAPARSDAPSSHAGGPEGIWQGSLQGVLRIVFHIERGPDGRRVATLDSPDQGAMGLAVDSVGVAGDSLHLVLRRLGAGYDGRFEASGDSITGRWRQGGYDLPLAVKRADQAPVLRRPQEPAKPYPYAEDTVRVENRAAGVSLAGTLTTPAGAGPFPCAVLITGSGPEDRDEAIFGHKPFLVLADHLTRHGIAVLRLDDRGVGASSGRFSTATSEDFASDIRAAVSYVATRPKIDRGHIGLIGHSEGGLIAPMVAAHAHQVAFVVLMAGPGVPGDSILILQSAAILRVSGVGEGVIARQTAARRHLHALIRGGADSVALLPAMRAMLESQIAAMPEGQRQALGDLDSLSAAGVNQLRWPWMRFFLTYDPRPALSRLTCPVLALNGSKDIQVPPKENLAAIETALKAGGHRRYSVKELPGLNHLFQSAGTGAFAEYGTIEETIAPQALAAISDWITAQIAAKR